MKEIKLKKIEMLNFKCVRHQVVNFSDGVTVISGRNRSGKTTVFDAFTWVLFGKDSHDRVSQDFSIKPVDEDGNEMLKLPHEVTVMLSVNGTDVELCRRYKEIWKTRRGSKVEELDGHEHERFVNNVPMSKAEYDEYINSICSEGVFKYITNPLFFSAQKTDAKRELLYRMAGNPSESDVFALKDDFSALVDRLQGKTIKQLQSEVYARKKAYKEEIANLPARIEERTISVTELEDWDALKRAIEEKEAKREHVDRMILDESEGYNDAVNTRAKMVGDLAQLKVSLQKASARVADAAHEEYNRTHDKQYELKSKRAQYDSILRGLKDEEDRLVRDLDKCKIKREALLSEWRTIQARELVIDDGAFVCPTCGRMLEYEDIQTKKADMIANFNAKKADDLEENKKAGLAIKEQKEALESRLAEVRKSSVSTIAQIGKIESEPIYSAKLECPDATEAIKADEECIRLSREIEELEQKINTFEVKPSVKTEELRQQKSELTSEIEDLKSRYSKKSEYEKNEDRKLKLIKQLDDTRDSLAELDGIEFLIAEFGKAKVELVESRINSMFRMVRFKMYDTHINGNESECCVAMVDGVPYDGGLNSADRINAGLDIINAICRFEGITAPIFIDNCESVNDVMDTDSQQIRLVVSDDENLTVK